MKSIKESEWFEFVTQRSNESLKEIFLKELIQVLCSANAKFSSCSVGAKLSSWELLCSYFFAFFIKQTGFGVEGVGLER